MGRERRLVQEQDSNLRMKYFEPMGKSIPSKAELNSVWMEGTKDRIMKHLLAVRSPFELSAHMKLNRR